MPEQKVDITVAAKNKTGPAFAAIAASGKTVGDTLQAAGVKASDSILKLEGTTTKSALAFARWKEAGQAAGAAVFGLTLLSTKLAAESEAVEARVTGAFENAGLAIEQWRAALDAAGSNSIRLGFDDEQSLGEIANLVSVTKNAEKAFTDLSLAQDIARARNIDLSSAVSMVIAAETGRYRALREVGIQLDANATSTQALSQLTELYSGSAERYAETSSATFDRIGLKIENYAEGIGASLGDVSTALMGLGAATTVASSLKGLYGGLKEAEAGSKLLSVAMGPAGLSAAALVAGAGILYVVTHLDKYESAAGAAADATQDLDNFFRTLASGVDPNTAAALDEFRESFNALLDDAGKRQDDLVRIQKLADAKLDAGFDLYRVQEGFDLTAEGAKQVIAAYADLDESQIDFINTNKDTVLSFDEIAAAITFYQANLDRLDASQIKNVQADLSSLFSKDNLNIQKAKSDIEEWMAALNAGTMSGDEFVAKIDYAASHFGMYLFQSNAATAGSREYTAATEGATAAMDALNWQMGEFASITADRDLWRFIEMDRAEEMFGSLDDFAAASVESLDLSAAALKRWSAAYDVAFEGMNTQAGEFGAVQSILDMQRAMESFRGGTELADAFNSVTEKGKAAAPVLADITDELMAQADRAATAASELQKYASSLDQLPGISDTVSAQLASGAAAAGQTLGDSFRVAVGNTNSIANQADQVNQWARELINVQGVYGKIDDLLASGAISQDEWNAAQDAGNRIFASSADIQQDVLAIQAKQAPLIADATQAQERYMDEISKLPAEQQRVALAYMDTSTSMKAQSALALAAAAANGELGAAGQKAAADIIAGAAAADPYLQSILEDMGLITVTDGEITINYDSVKDTDASISDLIAKLDAFIAAIAEAFNIEITSNADAQAGSVGGLLGALNALDGKKVYYEIIGQGGGAGLGVPGQTPEKAGGGMVRARMGELGGEYVSLAGGGTAYAPSDGMYSVPSGSYVHTAPVSRTLTPGANMGGMTVPITIYGNVYGMDDLEAQVAAKLGPALEIAMRERRRAKGMRVA